MYQLLNSLRTSHCFDCFSVVAPVVINGIKYVLTVFNIFQVLDPSGPCPPSCDFKDGSPRIISSAPISAVQRVDRSIYEGPPLIVLVIISTLVTAPSHCMTLSSATFKCVDP